MSLLEANSGEYRRTRLDQSQEAGSRHPDRQNRQLQLKRPKSVAPLQARVQVSHHQGSQTYQLEAQNLKYINGNFMKKKRKIIVEIKQALEKIKKSVKVK